MIEQEKNSYKDLLTMIENQRNQEKEKGKEKEKEKEKQKGKEREVVSLRAPVAPKKDQDEVE